MLEWHGEVGGGGDCSSPFCPSIGTVLSLSLWQEGTPAASIDRFATNDWKLSVSPLRVFGLACDMPSPSTLGSSRTPRGCRQHDS